MKKLTKLCRKYLTTGNKEDAVMVMKDENTTLNIKSTDSTELAQQKKKVMEIYVTTLGVTNLIDEMQNLTDTYYKNNWSVALSNLSYDLRNILSTMEAVGFSFDYDKAQTFMSYVRIFDYLVTKMTDDLIVYSEGIASVKMIVKNLKMVSKPYAAFVCSRIRDLKMIQEIPPKYLSMYKKYEEEGIDKTAAIDMSNIFEFAFPEEDDVVDDIYLDEVKDQMTKMFGDEYDISDFEKISQVLVEYSTKMSEESKIEYDY